MILKELNDVKALSIVDTPKEGATTMTLAIDARCVVSLACAEAMPSALEKRKQFYATGTDSGIGTSGGSAFPSTSDYSSLLRYRFESTGERRRATVDSVVDDEYTGDDDDDDDQSAVNATADERRRRSLTQQPTVHQRPKSTGATPAVLYRRQSSSSVFYKSIVTANAASSTAVVTGSNATVGSDECSLSECIDHRHHRHHGGSFKQRRSDTVDGDADTVTSETTSITYAADVSTSVDTITCESINDVEIALVHTTPVSGGKFGSSASRQQRGVPRNLLRLESIPAVDDLAEAATTQRSSIVGGGGSSTGVGNGSDVTAAEAHSETSGASASTTTHPDEVPSVVKGGVGLSSPGVATVHRSNRYNRSVSGGATNSVITAISSHSRATPAKQISTDTVASSSRSESMPTMPPNVVEEDEPAAEVKKDLGELSMFDRVTYLLHTDPVYQKEVDIGKRIGFYRISKELGSGNFSKVKLGVHVLTKEKVAVKIMEKTPMDRKGFKLLKREIENMEEAHHPNVVHLFEVIDTLSRVYLCMEYADGGELYNYVAKRGRLQATEVANIYAQVIAAVKHLHSIHIIHRDIKAENVFFSGPKTVKLGDFGFSTRVSREDDQHFLNTFCGSPPYAAPELYREHDKAYMGEPVDIWALGIMLFFMNTGYTPFRAESIADLKQLILDGTFSVPEYVGETCQALIFAILQQSPALRLTVSEIMKHPFLNGAFFPEAHIPYSTMPNENDLINQSSNSVVPKVWRRLELLGINNEKLLEASDKGSANAIIGTYRIVLYQMLLVEGEEVRCSAAAAAGRGAAVSPSSAASTKPTRKQRSMQRDKSRSSTSSGGLCAFATGPDEDSDHGTPGSPSAEGRGRTTSMQSVRRWLKAGHRKSSQFCAVM